MSPSPAKTDHACRAIAQTLSFALPAPWGPVVAAGIQLIDMLLASQDEKSDPNKELLDALTAQTQELENFLVTMKLDDLNADLKTIGGGIDETAKELQHASNRGVGAQREAITNQLDHELDWVLETDNRIEYDMNRLVGMSFPGNDRYTLGQTAVELYLNMLMAYVCLLKLRCELRSQLIDTYGSGADESAGVDPALLDELYGELDTFWSRLEHWTSTEQMTKFDDWCKAIKTDRLKLISDVQTEGKDAHGFFLNDTVATDYFTDGGRRIDGRAHEATYDKYDPEAPVFLGFVSHRDEVQARHDEYVAAQKQQMEIDFSYVAGTVSAIKNQVNQVKDLQAPPLPPVLKIDLMDTHWDSAWQWSADTEFRYGIALGNQKGTSETTWTGWQKSPGPGKTCPKLTLPGIPAGPGGPLAETRIIHRELRRAGSPDRKANVLATLAKENATTEYVDLDPADPTKVCPPATAVPVVVAWQRAQNGGEPHPSWPPGYRVRYRYTCVNAAGVSLSPSAWAQPADSSVADPPGADGFLTGKSGGYLAELKILRHAKATGCRVARELGGKRLYVDGELTTEGRFFKFKDRHP